MSSNGFALPTRYRLLPGYTMVGGYGAVQPVLDTFLDRNVLLKYMQLPQNNFQLLNEIQALAKARSRHVIEIYDVVKDNNGLVAGIMIEWLTGRDYLGFHGELKNDPSKYIRILYQISTALADLHAAGIVHRDLKLANLKESASGILKIFDFGLSSLNSDYRTSANRGTLVYAAPELYTQDAPITKEMDVYAFGVCAWALAWPDFPPQLHERPPQQSSRAISIQSVIGNLFSPEITGCIDACLHPDPNQRPSATQISSLFAKYLVQNKHRGIFAHRANQIYELSSQKPIVHLKVGALGRIQVSYNSLYFLVTEVEGYVLINNHLAQVNMVLPDSCVLTFGEYSIGWARQWITFSSSHPGVVL